MKILYLPGLDGTASLRSEFAESMGPEHSVDLITYPGDEVLGYEGYVDLVRQRLPVDEDFWIIGESFSGPIALMIAAGRPASLKGIVLAASFAANPSQVPAFVGWGVRWMPFHLDWYRRLSARALYGKWLTPARKADLDTAVRKVSIAVLTARIRAVLTVDCTDMLSTLNLPLLYLQAGEDRIIKSEIGQRILASTPGAELATVDAPHFLLSAEPHKCAAMISDFIKRHTHS